MAKAIHAFKARRLKRREQQQDSGAQEDIDRGPNERRGADKERRPVFATEADGRIRGYLMGVISSADALQHPPEGVLHVRVARRELTRLDGEQPVADRSGARVHADDPPAPVKQDGAGPQVIETALDPPYKHGAPG
jgi:hypothetical protein